MIWLFCILGDMRILVKDNHEYDARTGPLGPALINNPDTIVLSIIKSCWLPCEWETAQQPHRCSVLFHTMHAAGW